MEHRPPRAPSHESSSARLVINKIMALWILGATLLHAQQS